MTTTPQTFDDLEEMAFGMVGISVSDFNEMTFPQFQNAVRGYERKMELQLRESWEQSRWQVWATLAPHQGKGKKLSLTDITLFEWEKQGKEAQEEKTKLDLDAEFKRVDSFWQQVDKLKE